MQARIFTVPNQLTILRLGFLPLFLIATIYGHFRIALAVLLIAALTDALDGFMARRLNQKTALGAYLDPIADKLLISSSFIVLALKGKIVWWLTIMVISRDVMLLTTAAVIILVSGYRKFPPSIYGKLTTFFEIVCVFGAIIGAAFPAIPLHSAQFALRYIVAFLTVFSGLHYSVTVARRMHGGSAASA